MTTIASKRLLTSTNLASAVGEHPTDVVVQILPYLGVPSPVGTISFGSMTPEHIAWLSVDTNAARTVLIVATARNTSSTKQLSIVRAVSLLSDASGTITLHAHDVYAHVVGTGWDLTPDGDGNSTHLVVASEMAGAAEVRVIGIDAETLHWAVRVDPV